MRTERIERMMAVASRRLRGYVWPTRETQARYADALLDVCDMLSRQTDAHHATRRERIAMLRETAIQHWAQATK